MPLRTDFEECGLARGALAPAGRALLLTVDCEAFRPEMASLWLDAMHRWADAARRHRLRFAFFLAVEDVVRLRRASAALYDDFLAAGAALAEADTAFHAHNHGAFDLETGRLLDAGTTVAARPGYRKRPSLFHSVVHSRRMDLGHWLATVRRLGDQLAKDMGRPPSLPTAFRAGGWDYGSSREDLGLYLGALRRAGYAIDSSACTGAYGTRSWRLGAPFGRNTFRCAEGLVEVAPCWALDCGAEAGRLPPLLDLIRRAGRRLWTGGRGVLVCVLHFDHLFHAGVGDGRRCFVVAEPQRIVRRIEATFTLLRRLQRLLHLELTSYHELALSLEATTGNGTGPATRAPHGRLPGPTVDSTRATPRHDD
jgi:hypothetical protein